MKQDSQITKTIALGGVLLALQQATLFFASFIPGIEMTLYALSSIYLAILIVQTSPKQGILFYVASLVLSLLFLPNKAMIIPYAFFFGIYGLIKYWIEQIRKPWAEILLKLLFFNVSWIGAYLTFGPLFLGSIELPDFAMGVILAGAQLFFLLYDAIFTLSIAFLINRFPKA